LIQDRRGSPPDQSPTQGPKLQARQAAVPEGAAEFGLRKTCIIALNHAVMDDFINQYRRFKSVDLVSIPVRA
jgi:hypothetical protein